MNKKGLYFSCLLLIFTQSIIPCVIAADYTLLLNENTSKFQIKTYNEKIWLDNIGSKYDNPSLLFGGDADIINAQSKITIKEWTNENIDVYDFLNYFYNDENLNKALEYNKKVLDNLLGSAELGNKYEAWMIIRDIWDPTTSMYDEIADKPECKFPILKDAYVFKNLLEEINIVTYPIYLASFLAEGDNAVNSTEKAKDALLTGNYFTWLLIFKKNMHLLNPTSNYFDMMIKSLKADAFDIEEDMITINAGKINELEANNKYTVEISLNSEGTVSKINFKDINDYVFYSEEIIYPIVYEYVILIFLGILIVPTLGFIYFLKKKKMKIRLLRS